MADKVGWNPPRAVVQSPGKRAYWSLATAAVDSDYNDDDGDGDGDGGDGDGSDGGDDDYDDDDDHHGDNNTNDNGGRCSWYQYSDLGSHLWGSIRLNTFLDRVWSDEWAGMNLGSLAKYSTLLSCA